MINLPKALTDIELLIRNQVPEDLHLEYKRSAAIDAAKRTEIVKDVSAFANSDGGVLIYGVEEDKQQRIPVGIDGGVDETRFGREWLEQVITSNIQPRIQVEIVAMPVSTGRSVLAVRVPRCSFAVQNALDHKYYKRHNFLSEPMEHYEIEDVRNRRHATPGRLTVRLETESVLIIFAIVNDSTVPLKNISFLLPKALDKWVEKKKPNALTRGIQFLGPGVRLPILWDSYLTLTKQGEETSFDITATYQVDGSDVTLVDEFHFDLLDYWNTRVEKTDAQQIASAITNGLDKVSKNLTGIEARLETLSRLADPTGLALSVTTMKRLQMLMSGSEPVVERLDLRQASSEVLVEVLGVDFETAQMLELFFGGQIKSLEEIAGVSPQLIEKLRRHFKVEDLERGDLD